jgi:spermidine dehydrogenase
MDDVVLARFDYDRLDREDSSVRIRLESTVIDVRQVGDAVGIGFIRAGVPHRIAAKHAVLACFHMMIPYLMPELPKSQRDALAKNVKTPLVYTNVLMRDWQPWLALKVSDIVAPTCFFNHVALDFPVDLGGYNHPRDPAEPIVVHLVHVPGAPNSGLDARAQFHVGQAKLLAMTFADFEARIRDQLDRMLGPGGFASERDIAAITVNRWSHGYGYAANSLFDPDDYEDRVLKVARQPFGRVAIANSDAGGDAYADVIANTSAIRRRIIGAIDGKLGPNSKRSFHGDLDQLCCVVRRLARAATWISASDIEVAQYDVTQIMSHDCVAQHDFRHQLGPAIGREAACPR